MAATLSDRKPDPETHSGLVSLRFKEPLEQEFLQNRADNHRKQLRNSLMFACVLLATIPVLALLIDGNDGFKEHGIFAIRSGLLVPILAYMLWITYTSNHARSLNRLAITTGIITGPLMVVISLCFAYAGWPKAEIGYVVSIFFIYFLLGLRFYPAVIITSTLLVSYIAYGLLSPSMPHEFIKQVILLLFATLVGGSGMYNLEQAQRQGFLRAKELSYLASKDSLTGLANRKTFSAHLERMWTHCVRQNKPLAVALVDIDHFKAFNDTYGHQHGDRCLARVATVLSAGFRRPLDLTGRYGGEEFVIVMPETDLETGLELLLASQDMLTCEAIEHDSSPTAGIITVSAGLATVNPSTSTRSTTGLLQTADRALYQAKADGRNRIIVSSSSETEMSTTGVTELRSHMNEMRQGQR